MMQLNANSHSLLLFQANCFVRGLTLRSNTVVENLCMCPNIGPAPAGYYGPVLIDRSWLLSSRLVMVTLYKRDHNQMRYRDMLSSLSIQLQI